MTTYLQTGRAGVPYYIVDFIWSDPKTGKKRRVRRAARDAKGNLVRSETAAEKAEHAIRAGLAAGTFEATEPKSAEEGTFAEYFANKYLPDARVRLKAQTIDQIQKTFKNALSSSLGSSSLDAIDATSIAALTRALHERELSAKTINNSLSVLRATLSHALEHGALAALPPIRWQKVPPGSFDFFTLEEATKLVEVGNPLVTLGLRTGMRIGELIALRWADVSSERKQLTVARSAYWQKGGKRIEGAPKNNRTRVIPLGTDALAALASVPGRTTNAYVFVDADGGPLTPTECKWPIWRTQDAAGLRRTGPHVLRHSFASHLVARGVGLPAVQQLMGHATIQMVMKYAHLAPDHLRSAIDALE